jgi:hypothetical protein
MIKYLMTLLLISSTCYAQSTTPLSPKGEEEYIKAVKACGDPITAVDPDARFSVIPGTFQIHFHANLIQQAMLRECLEKKGFVR